jgi:hypothetical protein
MQASKVRNFKFTGLYEQKYGVLSLFSLSGSSNVIIVKFIKKYRPAKFEILNLQAYTSKNTGC